MTYESLKELPPEKLLDELCKQIALAKSIVILPGAMRDDMGVDPEKFSDGTLCEIGDFHISARFA